MIISALLLMAETSTDASSRFHFFESTSAEAVADCRRHTLRTLTEVVVSSVIAFGSVPCEEVLELETRTALGLPGAFSLCSVGKSALSLSFGAGTIPSALGPLHLIVESPEPCYR